MTNGTPDNTANTFRMYVQHIVWPGLPAEIAAEVLSLASPVMVEQVHTEYQKIIEQHQWIGNWFCQFRMFCFFTLDVQAAPQFRPKVSEPINVQSMATAVQPCIKQLRPLAA